MPSFTCKRNPFDSNFSPVVSYGLSVPGNDSPEGGGMSGEGDETRERSRPQGVPKSSHGDDLGSYFIGGRPVGPIE